jgi:hypothetical protein
MKAEFLEGLQEEDEMANENRKKGSGVTTRDVVKTLRETMVRNYQNELAAMSGGRVGFKPKQVKDMVAGFEDGFRNAVHHLQGMGVILVVDDAATANALAAEKKA